MQLNLTTSQENLLQQAKATLGRLRELLAQTDTAVNERQTLADSIQTLDDLFLLVVAGEFNAGKSAFINALFGQHILPEGVTPTTAQIHLLTYGEEVTAKPTGPGLIRMTAPVAMLQHIHLVDTPGTNAINREHEAITADFIPRSDLVLFITSADRPFSESERAFLTRIRDWGKKIVLIINKIDILEDEAAVAQVVQFVTEAAHSLVGEIAAVFPVSGRLAQQAKAGQPQKWAPSRFEALETYVTETLDERGRFQLKLMNPLGVGQRLVTAQLASTHADLQSLLADRQLLADIQHQTTYYNEDMQRNFRARLSEIDNLLHQMEGRGSSFFDETIRLGRLPDLARSEKIKALFQEEVIGDTAKQIEARVSELVDWLVEQDLRQWTAVTDHLSRRQKENDARIVGERGGQSASLAYERQRLIATIGKEAERAVDSYDQTTEANRLATAARETVAGLALAGVVSGAGIGAAIFIASSAVWIDITGVSLGIVGLTVGLIMLPARRRKAKNELHEKLDTLREKLVSSLTTRFDQEMLRSSRRIEEAVAPFSRFVRAESDKFKKRQAELQAIKSELDHLQSEIRQL
ncbi:MAG: dynamin family protein [Anaerolineales bacterium]|nr:dynamin family protein [Anaerolineales bacterium]MCB8959409.1 dynamin family protein [Ardenticatenales bacterium]